MKNFIRKYIGGLFFTTRFYVAGGAIAALFFIRHFVTGLGALPFIFLWAFVLLFLIEYILLFIPSKALDATRQVADKLSNGDENKVTLYLKNNYSFPVQLTVIDEIPFQFQRRDVHYKTSLQPHTEKQIQYQLRPVKRGVYGFGRINSYASCLTGLVQRRYKNGAPVNVAVYPSFLQLRKYQLMALHNRLQDAGLKRQRHLGNSFEFDQTKEYVTGDDIRKINWKTTARRGSLMVNYYTDEKSQPIYSLIDKGRLMEMPFDGMTLLDYAINASLVLSNIALYKEDKAGVFSFSKNIETMLIADRKPDQMLRIQEMLYHQKTNFPESDFERLYISIKHNIPQRSCLMLYTNFETLEGFKRQANYLRKLAQAHLLIVIFFQNSVVYEIIEKPVNSVKDAYTQTIAETFEREKRLIVKELQKLGILAILTRPQNLTVNALNKYLEIKSRNLI